MPIELLSKDSYALSKAPRKVMLVGSGLQLASSSISFMKLESKLTSFKTSIRFFNTCLSIILKRAPCVFVLLFKSFVDFFFFFISKRTCLTFGDGVQASGESVGFLNCVEFFIFFEIIHFDEQIDVSWDVHLLFLVCFVWLALSQYFLSWDVPGLLCSRQTLILGTLVEFFWGDGLNLIPLRVIHLVQVVLCIFLFLLTHVEVNEESWGVSAGKESKKSIKKWNT